MARGRYYVIIVRPLLRVATRSVRERRDTIRRNLFSDTRIQDNKPRFPKRAATSFVRRERAKGSKRINKNRAPSLFFALLKVEAAGQWKCTRVKARLCFTRKIFFLVGHNPSLQL